MANKDDPTSGGRGLDLSNYIAFNRRTLKLTFRPLALVGAILGGGVLAFFEGWVFVVQGLFAVVQVPFQFAESVVTAFIRVVFGVGGVFQASWIAARAEVIGSGVAAFAVAVAISAAALYVAAIGVDQLG